MNRQACSTQFGTAGDDGCVSCNIPGKNIGFTATAKYVAVRCGVSFTGRGVGVSRASQEDANNRAMLASHQQASALANLSGLVCPPPLFVSTQTATVTVNCQDASGSATASATATYESSISQTDADTRAIALATSKATSSANSALVCTQTVYTSTRSYTASCPDGYFGSTSSATATATSIVSQDDADSQALASATSEAEAGLNCMPLYTATVTQTVNCPDGQTGPPSTATASATSTSSQDDAYNNALENAIEAASSGLVCTPIVYTSTQYASVTCTDSTTQSGSATQSGSSQEEADINALNAAIADAQSRCPS